MPHLVHNERSKLVANALDRASTASIAAGIFAPVATATLGQSQVSWDQAAASVVFWLVCAAILHIEARRQISTLRE
jgi:hypothetical protein